ncbi:MAG: hypothetical protein U0361_01950 [Nitrospiraceae bacterium]
MFVDNQELLVKDAIRHTISDDMEDSAKEVVIIPMKQIKYVSCDATVFASEKADLSVMKEQGEPASPRQWS